ncbi:Hypothetical predicted protein, partial [Paramuricea clavata]
ELCCVATEWNVHPIRSNKNIENPHGKPDVMHFTPELYNTHNYETQVAFEDVAICEELYTKEKPSDYDQGFLGLVQLVRPNITIPTTTDDALEPLYQCYSRYR